MDELTDEKTTVKRKRLIVDKGFQLRTAFTFTGMAMLFMGLVIAVMAAVMVSNHRYLDELSHQQQNLAFNQREIVESLLVFDRVRTWDNLRLATDKASRDLQWNSEKIRGNQVLIRHVIVQDRALLAAIVVIAAVQLIVVFRILIRKTHRISGPAFLLGRYMDEIIRGEYPRPRPLRDGDELAGLYEKFGEMVKAIEAREVKVKKKGPKRGNPVDETSAGS